MREVNFRDRLRMQLYRSTSTAFVDPVSFLYIENSHKSIFEERWKGKDGTKDPRQQRWFRETY
jgi:hypothetical protein